MTELPRQNQNPQALETLSLHAGQQVDPATGAGAVPIYLSSSYFFKSTRHAVDLFELKEFGNIYTRLQNPTTEVWEKRLAALEGGSGALGTASGMAAIFLAIHNLAQMGDHLVTTTSLYGGTDTLFRHTLPQMGIQTTFVADSTPANIAAAIQENTKAVYIETIANPSGNVLDITGIADAAHAQGIPLIIDNTFAPLICRPIELGADIVIHSCTKWICGHGTSMGGIIVDGGRFDWAASGRFGGFTEPDASYHGLVYWDAFGSWSGLLGRFRKSSGVGQHRLYGKGPRPGDAQYRAVPEPLQRLSIYYRTGIAAPAHQTPVRKRPGPGPIPQTA